MRWLLLMLLLPGCAYVGEDFVMPEFGLEVLWEEETSQYQASDAVLADRWWESFEDSTLNTLIEKARDNNRDVKEALANLQAARAGRDEAFSQYYPDTSIENTAERRGLNRTTSGDGNNVVRERNEFQTRLDASWEIDLFGGITRSVEASDALMAQREAQWQDVWLSAAAEVAQSYVAARGLEQEIAVNRRNAQLLLDTEALVQAQVDGGAANEFDLFRAQAERQAIEAAIPELEAELFANLQRLKVLTANKADDALPALGNNTLGELKATVPVGLPSELLKRRPDVRAATQELKQSTAFIGVEEAALFPSFSLTGKGFATSRSFGDMFTTDATSYAWGSLVEWNILQYPTIQARIEQAEAERNAAKARYERTVLEALEDVQASLMQYGKGWQRIGLLRKTLKSREEAARISKLRYEAGQDDLLPVIDAERSLAAARLELTQAETNTRIQLVQLYKALGGGVEF